MTAAFEIGDDPPVYLDHQATTPLDRRVLDAMMPWLTDHIGNPHSVSHAYGREALAAVEAARAAIALLIGAEPREIVFTSGATESNNLAIKGIAGFQARKRRGFITLATEHKCVLECHHWLAGQGFDVTFVPVDRDGLVDLDALSAAIGDDTALVSIMAAHNEIGVIQPVAEIGRLCREKGAHFHTDAAQAAGKIPLDVNAMSIDLLSISGHKMYGPKGIGALYVRRRPRTRLEPQMSGGGQERGLRSGTLAPSQCVGLGTAATIAAEGMAAEAVRLGALRDRLRDGVLAALPDTVVNGHATSRLSGNLNLGFAGIDAEALIEAMPDIAISTGSACTSASVEPSYVLSAIGVEEAVARGSIRIGLGRTTTEDDIDRARERIVAAVTLLRSRENANAAASAAQ